MGYFGSIFRNLRTNFGPITKVIRQTIGQKSSLLGKLASNIPVVGGMLQPMVESAARDWGQGKTFKNIGLDMGSALAKQYGFNAVSQGLQGLKEQKMGLDVVGDKNPYERVSLRPKPGLTDLKRQLQSLR